MTTSTGASRFLATILVLSLLVASAGDRTATAQAQQEGSSRKETPLFERDVLPVLRQHCLMCHGKRAREGGLDLRTTAVMFKGGESGPAVQKGSPAKSLLFEYLSDGTMPPEGEARPTAIQIEMIWRWIDSGAPAKHADAKVMDRAAPLVSDEDRRFAVFQKLARPKLPNPEHADRVRTEIDAFVLARLEANGLSFSPDADRPALVRRLYFDLIGLPPAPEQVDSFLADTSPGAYGRLVDQLLASPHFGERWGRHWLDAAGYVDVYGSDENAPSIRLPPGGWRYRDYVIAAFNHDKPYNRFLVEQIAGDELVDWRAAEHFTPEMKELLVATGLLRTAIDDTDQDVLNIPSNRYATMFDQMEIFGSCVLGLTLQCARCHSHKFDPIPQRDYYRLLASFTPAYNPQTWVKLDDRTLPDVSTADKAAVDQHNARCDGKIKALTEQIAALDRAATERVVDTKLAALPEKIRADVKAAVRRPSDRRDEVQAYLAGKFEALIAVTPEAAAAARSSDEASQVDAITRQVAAVNGSRKTHGWIQALYDTGPPPPTPILIRGNYEKPGPTAEHGFLSVLCATEELALAAHSKPKGETSGRRLALANWLTDPQTPAGGLVARVMVNRLWHHMFGRGIVATPGNLGRSGTPPTHPQLLDWLAHEFVRSGWRIKPTVKRMVTSTAYRQASLPDTAESTTGGDRGDPTQIDPENHLLWRMRMRRLESEIIRDAILAASGKLDRSRGGEPVPLKVRSDGMTVIATDGMSTPTSHWRRSIYVLSRRNYNVSMLSVFDMPVITTNCTSRNSSAVVLQSLTMLNDEFILRQADFFAARVASREEARPEKWIESAFRLALTRGPTAKELAWSGRFLKDQATTYRAAQLPPAQAEQKALASLCHMLLSTSEFLYVD